MDLSCHSASKKLLQANLLSFDEILESKIQWGSYQNRVMLILFFSILGDGCEMLVCSLLFPIFKNQWHVDEEMINIFGTFMFFGFLCGPILGGYLTDRLGRKYSLLLSTIG